MFGWIGNVVVRWPLLVIAVWIALAAGLTSAFPPLGVLAQKAPASILPNDAPSVVSQKQMAEAFKEASSDNILLVVLTNENGFTAADEAVYRDLVGKLRAETDDVAALQDFVTTPPLREILVSKDNKAWLLPVNIVGEIATPKAIAATKRAMQTVKDTVAGTSLQAFTTGPAGTFNDIQDIGDRDRITIEVATVVALLSILLMVYRNILTMLLPLITIGVSLVTAQGVVAGLGTLGLSVSNQTIVLLTAMLAGAGTDYAVFLISRYHDYLRDGDDSDTALRNSLESVGKVITASAATVAVTFIGMVFTKLTVFYTVGVALAAAIIVGCIGAVTFLPALLVLAGRRGWAKPRRDLTGRFWRRSGIRIVRRPAINLLASLVILAILAGSAFLATYNYDDRKALPAASDSIQGYDAISRHFPINASLPQYILISSPRDSAHTGGVGGYGADGLPGEPTARYRHRAWHHPTHWRIPGAGQTLLPGRRGRHPTRRGLDRNQRQHRQPQPVDLRRRSGRRRTRRGRRPTAPDAGHRELSRAGIGIHAEPIRHRQGAAGFRTG